jgi:tripartite-type tricarboxylate transporter receptor subunit TctC
MLTRRNLCVALALGAATLSAAPASAQGFTKPVTLIVPYAPGGSSDILARLIGPELSKAIGQPVVVENRPSSSGIVGTDYVARAAGDGHTLLITDVGTLATIPHLFKKLNFDAQKDLVAVGMVMFSPYLFAVHPSVPANTIQELAAYDKSNPGKLNVATSGVGSVQHLTAIVVGKHYGINWNIVPYKGGAAAVRAVIGNESNVIFNGAIATQPYVVQKQMKGIAVSGDKRLAALPDLPSFKEIAMPIIDAGSWQGFFTSKGTPPALVARLNAEIRKIVATPEISKRIVDLGGEVRAGSAEELGAWVGTATGQWGEVIRAEKITLD